MKGFLLGLVLGFSLAAVPIFAELRDSDGNLFSRPRETWSQRQAREALEYPIDQYGNSYSNDGGYLTPNFSPGTRRGPC